MWPHPDTPGRGDADLKAIHNVWAVCGTVRTATTLLQGPGVLMLQAEVACQEPRTRKPLSDVFRKLLLPLLLHSCNITFSPHARYDGVVVRCCPYVRTATEAIRHGQVTARRMRGRVLGDGINTPASRMINGTHLL